jgi:hypothetical protein
LLQLGRSGVIGDLVFYSLSTRLTKDSRRIVGFSTFLSIKEQLLTLAKESHGWKEVMLMSLFKAVDREYGNRFSVVG